MDRKEPESIGEVLRNLLEETSLQSRIDELKAIDLWPRIVGHDIAVLCKKPTADKGVMKISVPNASLRQELHMNRTKIKNAINSELGKQSIIEIKFTS